MLTTDELERYDRQIMIRELGEEGQEKLKRAKVIIAGSGGLGCPASIYLAAAGVGTIRIVDHDRVELSNLNRQVLHWDKDVSRSKVDSAVITCIQATEVIKYIVGIVELLTNRLLVYDGLNLKFTELMVKRDLNCEHCGHLVRKE